MVKKDWQDLRVWFNQAADVLTSLRIQLVHLRQACFHNLSCTREVPLPSPEVVPGLLLRDQVPSPWASFPSLWAREQGETAWPWHRQTPLWQWLWIKCTTPAQTQSGIHHYRGWMVFGDASERRERREEKGSTRTLLTVKQKWSLS